MRFWRATRRQLREAVSIVTVALLIRKSLTVIFFVILITV